MESHLSISSIPALYEGKVREMVVQYDLPGVVSEFLLEFVACLTAEAFEASSDGGSLESLRQQEQQLHSDFGDAFEKAFAILKEYMWQVVSA